MIIIICASLAFRWSWSSPSRSFAQLTRSDDVIFVSRQPLYASSIFRKRKRQQQQNMHAPGPCFCHEMTSCLILFSVLGKKKKEVQTECSNDGKCFLLDSILYLFGCHVWLWCDFCWFVECLYELWCQCTMSNYILVTQKKKKKKLKWTCSVCTKETNIICLIFGTL